MLPLNKVQVQPSVCSEAATFYVRVYLPCDGHCSVLNLTVHVATWSVGPSFFLHYRSKSQIISCKLGLVLRHRLGFLKYRPSGFLFVSVHLFAIHLKQMACTSLH